MFYFFGELEYKLELRCFSELMRPFKIDSNNQEINNEL